MFRQILCVCVLVVALGQVQFLEIKDFEAIGQNYREQEFRDTVYINSKFTRLTFYNMSIVNNRYFESEFENNWFTQCYVNTQITDCTQKYFTAHETEFDKLRNINFQLQYFLYARVLIQNSYFEDGKVSFSSYINSEFSNNQYKNVTFSQVSFVQCLSKNPVYENVVIAKSNYNHVAFEGAQFKNVFFSGCSFIGVSFKGAIFQGGSLDNIDQSQVDFTDAVFKNTRINGEMYTSENQEEERGGENLQLEGLERIDVERLGN